MKRADILARANEIVHGPREANYGPPDKNFDRIARLWSVILDTPVTMAQVVLCMDAVKTARLCENEADADGWIDKAGYSACGGEVTRAGESAPAVVVRNSDRSEPLTAQDIDILQADARDFLAAEGQPEAVRLARIAAMQDVLTDLGLAKVINAKTCREEDVIRAAMARQRAVERNENDDL